MNIETSAPAPDIAPVVPTGRLDIAGTARGGFGRRAGKGGMHRPAPLGPARDAARAEAGRGVPGGATT